MMTFSSRDRTRHYHSVNRGERHTSYSPTTLSYSPQHLGIRMQANTPPAHTALAMLRRATKGALGTARAADGHPYVSMVLVATGAGLRPLFLLSRLALHTQNLLTSPASSLLIDETDTAGDPVAGGRLTLIGETFPVDDDADKAIFLSRHPSAQTYVSFADFGVYAMTVESAHLIQGFGRIVTIDRDGLAGVCA
jgi:heme iron utilization protein